MQPPQPGNNLNVQDAARDRIALWRAEPVRFVREVFHVEPTEQQRQGLEALTGSAHITIRSGHGTGKTAFLAWSIIHAMTCYYPSRIPCTAPTGHQLDDILWRELALWHQAMEPQFQQLFDYKIREFNLKSNPEISFAVGRTSSRERPEALQGFHMHSGLLRFIIDEASGVPDKVFEVAEGALSTRHSSVLMTSNPTRRRGYFYDSHHMFGDEYLCLHWDSEKSPLVDEGFIGRMARKYGKDSNVYRVRVLGDFPMQEEGSVISYDSVVAAQNRDVEQVDGPVVWGVDVARGGKDRSVLSKRRMNVMLEQPIVWRGLDTEQLSDIIAEEYDNTDKEERPDEIIIDVIGLGAGVFDNLHYRGLPALGCNVSERASASDRFNRLRDELWVKCAHWFSSGSVRIPDVQNEVMDDFISQLTSIKYDEPTPQGKAKVQSKIDIRDEDTGIRMASPDMADAFVLTFRSYIKRDAMLVRKSRFNAYIRRQRNDRTRLNLL